MDTLYAGFLVLAFLAVFMFIEGLYLTWNAYLGPEARRVERRLQAMSASGNQVPTPLLKKRLLSEVPLIEQLLLRVPRVHVLDRFLLQSGMTLSVASFLGVAAALASAAAAGAALAGLPALPVAGAAGLAAGLWFAFVQRRRQQRMHLIEQQLPDTLDLMARAMQAGHSFSSALLLVGAEGPQPIAQEFQTVFDEINYGIPTASALAHMASRVASSDLRFFVVAVLIQSESGGNLSEILGSIAVLIRERQKLAATVRVLSAEGRVSAWILSLLPFALATVLLFVNKEFIGTLWTDPIGAQLAGFALGLMAVGLWWMWRLVKIRV